MTTPSVPQEGTQPPPPSTTTTTEDASRQQPAALPPTTAELARAKVTLGDALRRFPDFPIPGINFLDIMPWFLDPALHALLLRSLELQLLHFGTDDAAPAVDPDVVVGLDARGFLFGPSLALRRDASFVPVRKQGKLPGPCVTAEYMKEYGADHFQLQEGSIKPGQKVLIVDDIIATGGSAAAAGNLVKQLGGTLIGYLFIIEIPFLKGRDKLEPGVPVVTLLDVNE